MTASLRTGLVSLCRACECCIRWRMNWPVMLRAMTSRRSLNGWAATPAMSAFSRTRRCMMRSFRWQETRRLRRHSLPSRREIRLLPEGWCTPPRIQVALNQPGRRLPGAGSLNSRAGLENARPGVEPCPKTSTTATRSSVSAVWSACDAAAACVVTDEYRCEVIPHPWTRPAARGCVRFVSTTKPGRSPPADDGCDGGRHYCRTVVT